MHNLDDTVEVVFYKVQSCNKSGQSCDLYCDNTFECVCAQMYMTYHRALDYCLLNVNIIAHRISLYH